MEVWMGGAYLNYTIIIKTKKLEAKEGQGEENGRYGDRDTRERERKKGMCVTPPCEPKPLHFPLPLSTYPPISSSSAPSSRARGGGGREWMG